MHSGGLLSNLTSEWHHQIGFRCGAIWFMFQPLKEMGRSHGKLKKNQSRYIAGALSCSCEHQSRLLNNLGRALWKLNYSLQHDEVSSQLGVPLVDSLLNGSIAWQPIRSQGELGRQVCIGEGVVVIALSLCPLQLNQPQALREESSTSVLLQMTLVPPHPTRDSRSAVAA